MKVSNLGKLGFALLLALANAGSSALAANEEPAAKTNPLNDSSFFPLAVWLQSPRNAERYRAAGINLYVGLWRGPTGQQLEDLERAGMHVICDQNATALAQKDNPIIAAWMHGDEPDNAQPLRNAKGYGPPIPPEKIQKDYQRIRKADPTRPVLLNLGQGVAWDNYIGRGVRRNHPEDYPEYLKGCDIASFDIYPVVHDAPEISGKLEFVGRGVERLRQWSGDDKKVWNCIECTHISNPNAKASPHQIRAEVWMSLIHGSRGIIYFVHQFKPAFKEAALLDDPENLAAITAINRQIAELAPVINSTNLTEITLQSENLEAVAFMTREHKGAGYLFTVNMRNKPETATVTVPSNFQDRSIEVIGEDRTLAVTRGQFHDSYQPYEVHLYRTSVR